MLTQADKSQIRRFTSSLLVLVIGGGLVVIRFAQGSLWESHNVTILILLLVPLLWLRNIWNSDWRVQFRAKYENSDRRSMLKRHVVRIIAIEAIWLSLFIGTLIGTFHLAETTNYDKGSFSFVLILVCVYLTAYLVIELVGRIWRE